MAEFTQGDKYSPFLHDAVMIYAIGLNITINTGGNVSDGATVARNMRGVTFRGMKVRLWSWEGGGGRKRPPYILF